MVCATSKCSDQPAHRRKLIRAFVSRLYILWLLSDWLNWTSFGVSKLKRRMHMLVWVYTCQNVTLLEITCHGSNDIRASLWEFIFLHHKWANTIEHTRLPFTNCRWRHESYNLCMNYAQLLLHFEVKNVRNKTNGNNSSLFYHLPLYCYLSRASIFYNAFIRFFKW